MKITNISVAKLGRFDPRYPEPIDGKPVTEAYLFTATIDGRLKECPFFVNGEMTADQAANMLKLFAKAMDREPAEAI